MSLLPSLKRFKGGIFCAKNTAPGHDCETDFIERKYLRGKDLEYGYGKQNMDCKGILSVGE